MKRFRPGLLRLQELRVKGLDKTCLKENVCYGNVTDLGLNYLESLALRWKVFFITCTCNSPRL